MKIVEALFLFEERWGEPTLSNMTDNCLGVRQFRRVNDKILQREIFIEHNKVFSMIFGLYESPEIIFDQLHFYVTMLNDQAALEKVNLLMKKSLFFTLKDYLPPEYIELLESKFK